MFDRKKLSRALTGVLLSVALLFGASGCDQVLETLDGLLQESETPRTPSEETAPKADEEYEYNTIDGNSDYYYSLLTEKQKGFYEELHQEMELFFGGDKTLETLEVQGTTYHILGDFSYKKHSLTATQALEAFEAFYRDCPAFYVFGHVYNLYGETHLYPVVAEEYLDQAYRAQIDESIEASVREVAALIKENYTDYDKFEIIYDYVIGCVDYEWIADGVPSTAAHAGSLVGVLDKDLATNAVCAGYSSAISYLCNLFGVECITVGNDTLNHAWNYVKIDGVWYYADATNDDGSGGKNLFLCGETAYWEFQNSSIETPLPVPSYDAENSGSICSASYLPETSKTDYSYLTFTKTTGGYEVSRAERNLEEIRIPDTYRGLPVVSIGNGAFSSATNVRSLVIPSTINNIAGGWLFLYASAFGNCSNLTSVFIKGNSFTASVGNGNSYFNNAKKYYYSETQPTVPGDYWHYDEVGQVIVWTAEEAENA